MRFAFALLFRLALALCPPGFRREYGAAMCDDYALAYREERTVHGAIGAAAYALGATFDLFTTAVREYAAMLFRDLSYALRTLRKQPLFAITVVVTLALAIGANASIFSILRAVVLAPLPYADPSRLVNLDGRIVHNDRIVGGEFSAFSLPDYADVIHENESSFASTAAYAGSGATMTGRGTPRSLQVIEVTPKFFTVFGLTPELGRFSAPSDVVHGTPHVVVISDALWRDAFASDPAAIGAPVTLDGIAYRVAAVVPPAFREPVPKRGFEPVDAWTYVPEDGAGTQYASRGWHDFNVVARLRPGVDPASVAPALTRTTTLMARRRPDDDSGLQVSIQPLDDALVGSARGLLFALFAAVGAVLLVACANVANLLLGRAASRDREFSVRIAIGASRGRIVMQLLVETFVLAFVGGVLGVGLAEAVVAGFVASHPANIPRADSVSIDAPALWYTFGVVAFCTLAAGLAPGFASSQRDVAVALKSAGRGGDASRGALARNVLVAGEIAMTLALVVAAGLVVRSYVALTSQSLGFAPQNLTLVKHIELPDSRYATDASVAAFVQRALLKVRALPGVRSADVSYAPPFSGSRYGTDFSIVGRVDRPGEEPDTTLDLIGPDYFRTIGATMVAGRTFSAGDRMSSQPVVIVNETLARAFFPHRSPIGAQLVPDLANDSQKHPPRRTIVGVVSDLRQLYTKSVEPTIFVPEAQMPQNGSSIVIASDPGVDPGPAAAQAIASLDPLLPAPTTARMARAMADNVAVQRLSVFALCALAFVALSLSIAGVFAVVSYGVSQRTHEFGVRMALGADAGGIVRMVLGGALRLAATGIVLGLVVAGVGTRMLGDQLYATQPLDPLTYGVVTTLVLAATVLAAFVPARRATRVDPIVALRYE